MADEPKPGDDAQAPQAAADKPAGATPAEPLKGEGSRTDSPGAGASAASGATAGKPATALGAEAAASRAPVAAKAAPPHPPAATPPSGPPDPPPPAGVSAPAFVGSLQSAIAGGVAALSFWVGDWTIIVPVAKLLDVAQHLRDA